MRSAEHAAIAPLTQHTGRGGIAMSSTRRVLNVKVGEPLQEAGARAAATMKAVQRGQSAAPCFGVSFSEIGQMLAAFTPKRWELIAMLRHRAKIT